MVRAMNVSAEGFKGKKALVVGGLGFIGSNLAIRLVSLGAKVVLVDALLPSYGGNSANIESIQGRCEVDYADIRNPACLDHLAKEADFIFSMAGQTSHIHSMTDPFTDLDINCRSQLSILESCRKINPAVQIIYAIILAQLYCT